MHTNMVEQAGADRNLFQNSPWTHHIDLKFPEYVHRTISNFKGYKMEDWDGRMTTVMTSAPGFSLARSDAMLWADSVWLPGSLILDLHTTFQLVIQRILGR